MEQQVTDIVKREAVPEYTKADLDLIKRTVAAGATDDELKLFIFDCNRQGVHPLDRMIHFSKRGKGDKRRYTPITSIDFMRSRAEATGEYAGNDDPVFSYNDKNYVVAATVTVHRFVKGVRCAFTATARWDEYCPGRDEDFMWQKMPHTMLGKCSEALALRKAFPKQLHGLYAGEEMDQAGNSGMVQPHGRQEPEQPYREDDGDQRSQEEQGQKPATPAQVKQICDLLSTTAIPDGQLQKWFEKAKVEAWEDMPQAAILKCIEYVKAVAREAAKNKNQPRQTAKPTSAASLAAEIKTWPKFLMKWAEACAAAKVDAKAGTEMLNLALSLAKKQSDPSKTNVQWRLGMLKAVAEGRMNKDGTIGAPS